MRRQTVVRRGGRRRTSVDRVDRGVVPTTRWTLWRRTEQAFMSRRCRVVWKVAAEAARIMVIGSGAVVRWLAWWHQRTDRRVPPQQRQRVGSIPVRRLGRARQCSTSGGWARSAATPVWAAGTAIGSGSGRSASSTRRAVSSLVVAFAGPCSSSGASTRSGPGGEPPYRDQAAQAAESVSPEFLNHVAHTELVSGVSGTTADRLSLVIAAAARSTDPLRRDRRTHVIAQGVGWLVFRSRAW